MPVEIRELVIRAVVVDTPASGSASDTRSEGGVDREAIVEECVRQVLKVLRRYEER